MLIVHIILSKLDNEVKKEWQEYDLSDVPKLDNMLQFLKRRCDILESFVKPNFRAEHANRVRSNAAMCDNVGESNYSINNNQNFCKICNEIHFIQNCPTFLSMSIPDRVENIKRLRLCFNCFKTNHVVKYCRAPKCSECQKNTIS